MSPDTLINHRVTYLKSRYSNFAYCQFQLSLWSPELDPHMVGGALFPGVVTENVSVRHWDLAETDTPLGVRMPLTAFPTVVTTVVGPVMVKVVKSSLSCKRNHYYCLNMPVVLIYSLTYLTNVAVAWAYVDTALSCLITGRLEVGTVLTGGGTTINCDCNAM